MKKLFIIAVLMLAAVQLSAQKKDITKTGLNFGPLPAIAYDADKGFQAGAILQIFDYGDGHNYPNYDSKLYLEASFFTKGSQLYQVRYDNKELIPGVRWCSAFRANLDKAYDFYGFNGYMSYYDYDSVAQGKDKESTAQMFSPFYRMSRNEFLFKSDFLGTINEHLQWEAGIFANFYKIGSINRDSINKGKDDNKKYTFPTTLYDEYTHLGIISEEEADGGFASGLRAGMVYDSRNKEGAPSSGIWAEGHITAALPGISETPFCRYSLTWRHYVPIVKNDILTFAYRLNYEGTFGKKAPFYALPYMSVMGEKQDLEGMGGYFTCRGIMRTRVVGLDMAAYNAEFRWRFAQFHIGKQNVALGLSAFSDGAVVTRGRDLSAAKQFMTKPAILNPEITEDRFHTTIGAGFRFIMNENFIVAAEYGTPTSHFRKNSPMYNQDGTGAFYINLGYLF